jgi:hypothetical protein
MNSSVRSCFFVVFTRAVSHVRPSSNKNREMGIEQFYIEKRDNFSEWVQELHVAQEEARKLILPNIKSEQQD